LRKVLVYDKHCKFWNAVRKQTRCKFILFFSEKKIPFLRGFFLKKNSFHKTNKKKKVTFAPFFLFTLFVTDKKAKIVPLKLVNGSFKSLTAINTSLTLKEITKKNIK
jgi:hypothetical protein